VTREHEPTTITTSGQADDPDDPDAIQEVAGTVVPRIRGRLRTRLPGKVRTARGQLLVLTVYLLLTPIFLGFQAVTGTAGLTGNTAFFFTVYQGVYLMFAVAVLVNLLREVTWSRTLVREARKSTGEGLGVPLRDIRIHPGAARTEVAAPGSAEEAAAQAKRRHQEPLLAVRGLK